MDSYYAILDDFVRETKRACKRAAESKKPDAEALEELLDAIDAALERVKERRTFGTKKKGGTRAKKKNK